MVGHPPLDLFVSLNFCGPLSLQMPSDRCSKKGLFGFGGPQPENPLKQGSSAPGSSAGSVPPALRAPLA
eukprot:2696015-Amphidinium_carterae.1